jgi:hypothetical protein
MHHPVHHIKKMIHILKTVDPKIHKHWPLSPLLFYLFGLFFLIAFIFMADQFGIIYLISCLICSAFGYVLGEIFIKMNE